MYTTKEIALEIDKLKPDITDFLQLFNERKSIKEISTDITIFDHDTKVFQDFFRLIFLAYQANPTGTYYCTHSSGDYGTCMHSETT